MRAKIFILWLCFFILGNGAASYFISDPLNYLILGVTICLLSFLIFIKRFFWGIIFGLGVFFISIFHFQLRSEVLEKINFNLAFSESNYTVSVNEPPIEYDNQQQITAEIINKNSFGFGKKVTFYAPKYPNYKFGDELKFVGKVKIFDENSGKYKKEESVGLAYAKEIEKTGTTKGPSTALRQKLYNLRSEINSAISFSLPEREAGLASGLILGEKASLTAEVKRALQASGTMHIIALSGYNITIILGLFQFLKTRFSRKVNLVIPFIFVSIFVVMTGASPSIVRAAIMGVMPILARCFGRGSDSFSLILLSAAIMLIFNPFLLIYDIGFQLSFAALLGMIYIGPILYNKASFLPSFISLPISETLGAQLVSLPILMYYFGTISVISPISNLLVLSLVPLCMLVSFLIGVFGMFNILLGKIIAIPGFILLKAFNNIIDFFGNLSFSSYQLEIKNPIIIVLLYLLILDFWFIFRKSVKCIRE